MRTRRSRFCIMALMCISLLALSGCGALQDVSRDVMRAFQNEEIWEQQFPIDTETPLRVLNRNGEVVLRTSNDATEIHVRAVKRAFQSAHLQDVEIAVDPASPFVIETKYLDERASVSVALTITVPTGTRVEEVSSFNGSLTISGSKGDLIASTSNGSITLHTIEGFVTATTSNGRVIIDNCTGVDQIRSSNGAVHAAIYSIRDDVSVHTSNGTIRLDLAPTLSAQIHANTSNGQISHDLALASLQTSSRTALSGSLGTGDFTMNVRTSNGSIDLLPIR